MYPSMPSKSTLWVKRTPFFRVEKISRGEIIIFRHKENGAIYDFIWRVIGLPGDNVRISGTSVYVNNMPLAHEKQKETSDKVIFLEKIDNKEYLVAYDVQPDLSIRIDINTVVPDKHFFLLGDNRDNAMDSRFKGFVSFDSVIGKKM
jgi:signal peptidase I